MDRISIFEQQAIKAAMTGNWEQAIEFNQGILKIQPKDTAALNRMAKAYWEKNDLPAAKKLYQKVLQIDPHNTITNNNLKRLVDQKKSSQKIGASIPSTNQATFLEEPGKTRIVKLVRLACHEILSQLDCADEVFLVPKERSIDITNHSQVYLGKLPEDLSHRILPLIKGGNQYRAFVKVVERQKLEIFIKETKRASRYLNTPSFTSRINFANKPRRE